MAYSYVNYTGNGSTTQFGVPMPYIRKEHVHVYINNVEQSFTWLTSTTVLLASAPANGAVVQVRRITPVLLPLVDFADGSTFVSADLDVSNLQHLYIEQELDDSNKQAIYVDPVTGQLTAGSQKIGNVGTPTLPSDAATKGYVDAGDAAAVAAAAADAASAAASATSANAAKVAAETARDQTLASYDNFDDRYLGAKASDPTLDNDGNALVGGALYFNTSAGQMRLWNGTSWIAAYVSGNASSIGFTPAAGIGSSNVQSAIEELSGRPVANYQEFLVNGTWSKPNNCTFVYVECIGGGAGGGSGAKQAVSGGLRTGGSGGGSGTFVSKSFPAAALTSAVSITVGTGGAGGPGATTVGSASNGANGNPSSFGTYLNTGSSRFGVAGSTTLTSVGNAGLQIGLNGYHHGLGAWGTSASGVAPGTPAHMSGGGGGGSGQAAGSTAATIGARGGYSATDGNGSGLGAAYNETAVNGGGGGGGGYQSGVNGQNGGNGAFPGGGGGGGGAADTTAAISGAGGSGANGVVRVWAW